MSVDQDQEYTGLSKNVELVIPQMEETSTVEQVESSSVQENVNNNVNCLCKCDRGQHLNWQIEDLGQKEWLGISKTELAKLDLVTIEGKCMELIQFINQQDQHTGFIPLSPLQFKPIRECQKCVSDTELCCNPVKLHNYVKSFGCPNFIGARIQVKHTMNLDLIDELTAQYWDRNYPSY